jgi:hypothetical protein
VAAPAATRNTQLAASKEAQQRLKGGDSGNRAEGESCLIDKKKPSNQKNFLTETGLLMEGVVTTVRFFFATFGVI